MISQFGARNLEENTQIKERKVITNSLNLRNIVDHSQEKDLKNLRIICDDDTYQNILSNKEYQNEISKYWGNVTNISDVTKIKLDKDFKNFKLLKQRNEHDHQVIYQNNTLAKNDKMKYEIDLHNNTLVRIKLTYIDNQLVKLTLTNSDGSKQKINLCKSENNKNKYSVKFHLLRQPELLLPIIRNDQIIGFIVKYNNSQSVSNVQYDMKEKESDIIIPDNSKEILESVKRINLRIDMTYFLKGKLVFVLTVRNENKV